MDRKIRIYFFPRDASRVRALVFSRRFGLAAAVAVVPLCLLGFWLVLSGKLREDPQRRFERSKLERETAALNEKTEGLQREIEGLRRNLDSLESIRIRVTLSSGLEGQEDAARDGAGRSGLSALARLPRLGGIPRARDVAAPLAKARDISHFMDSTLFVLSRDGDLASRLPTASPVAAHAIVTRGFGPARDPFTGRRSLHAGVDFSLAPGSPVRAAGGGVVAASGADPVWGYFVRIRHSDRAETFYAHLERLTVSAGRVVARGDLLGHVGNSGATTGPHLHFELRLRGELADPLPYLLSGGMSGSAARFRTASRTY